MVYRDSCASTKRDSFKNVTVTTFTKLALLLNSIEMENNLTHFSFCIRCYFCHANDCRFSHEALSHSTVPSPRNSVMSKRDVVYNFETELWPSMSRNKLDCFCKFQMKCEPIRYQPRLGLYHVLYTGLRWSHITFWPFIAVITRCRYLCSFIA